jgi:hypothetical protein
MATRGRTDAEMGRHGDAGKEKERIERTVGMSLLSNSSPRVSASPFLRVGSSPVPVSATSPSGNSPDERAREHRCAKVWTPRYGETLHRVFANWSSTAADIALVTQPRFV